MHTTHRAGHRLWRLLLGTAVFLVLISTGLMTVSPVLAEASGTSAAAVRAAAPVLRKVTYGDQAGQWVQLTRPVASGRRPAVIFVHGGGWVGGGVSMWARESAYWAARGWVSLNASYRMAPSGTSTPDHGRAMLADMTSILHLARSLPYVDRSRVIVVGDSAGGHLAAWMGARHYGAVAGVILWSPVASPAAAEAVAAAWDDAPDCPQLCAQQRSLGVRAARIFGSAAGTSPLPYLEHYGPLPTWVAGSTDEWVPYDHHGATLCAASQRVCAAHEVPGVLHGTKLRDADRALVVSARHWASVITRTPVF
jgi:acetyl esterase/lipase